MIDERILILKSLAANLPILRTWGYSFPRVITVVVEPGMQVRLMDALINFPENYNQSANAKNSDFVIWFLGKKSGKQESVEEIRRQYFFDTKGHQGLPLIVTDNPFINDEDHNKFYIFMEEQEFFSSLRIADIVPFAEELESVREKILGQLNAEMSEEEKMLRAAVYFLEPYFYRKGHLSKINELLELVNRLCIMDEEARDTHDVEVLFINTLYDWQKAEGFSDVYEVGGGDCRVSDVQKVMFYDEKFIYMSEKLFKKIVEPLLQYIPMNSLKKGLFDCGIIDTGNDVATTYTVKVRIASKVSGYNRVRLMRLKREKLEAPGMLDIVDACYFTKEEGDGDE